MKKLYQSLKKIGARSAFLMSSIAVLGTVSHCGVVKNIKPSSDKQMDYYFDDEDFLHEAFQPVTPDSVYVGYQNNPDYQYRHMSQSKMASADSLVSLNEVYGDHERNYFGPLHQFRMIVNSVPFSFNAHSLAHVGGLDTVETTVLPKQIELNRTQDPEHVVLINFRDHRENQRYKNKIKPLLEDLDSTNLTVIGSPEKGTSEEEILRELIKVAQKHKNVLIYSNSHGSVFHEGDSISKFQIYASRFSDEKDPQASSVIQDKDQLYLAYLDDTHIYKAKDLTRLIGSVGFEQADVVLAACFTGQALNENLQDDLPPGSIMLSLTSSNHYGFFRRDYMMSYMIAEQFKKKGSVNLLSAIAQSQYSLNSANDENDGVSDMEERSYESVTPLRVAISQQGDIPDLEIILSEMIGRQFSQESEEELYHRMKDMMGWEQPKAKDEEAFQKFITMLETSKDITHIHAEDLDRSMVMAVNTYYSFK